mmetsp:Transcript_64515/g.135395  ORF Transcript_64515/g.135395 Transcript_64515/m.135395 type:complete len:273 (+) Transcript_64515:2412-3230(+)
MPEVEGPVDGVSSFLVATDEDPFQQAGEQSHQQLEQLREDYQNRHSDPYLVDLECVGEQESFQYDQTHGAQDEAEGHEKSLAEKVQWQVGIRFPLLPEVVQGLLDEVIPEAGERGPPTFDVFGRGLDGKLGSEGLEGPSSGRASDVPAARCSAAHDVHAVKAVSDDIAAEEDAAIVLHGCEVPGVFETVEIAVCEPGTRNCQYALLPMWHGIPSLVVQNVGTTSWKDLAVGEKRVKPVVERGAGLHLESHRHWHFCTAQQRCEDTVGRPNAS